MPFWETYSDFCRTFCFFLRRIILFRGRIFLFCGSFCVFCRRTGCVPHIMPGKPLQGSTRSHPAVWAACRGNAARRGTPDNFYWRLTCKSTYFLGKYKWKRQKNNIFAFVFRLLRLLQGAWDIKTTEKLLAPWTGNNYFHHTVWGEVRPARSSTSSVRSSNATTTA